jgi:hypothetical protein
MRGGEEVEKFGRDERDKDEGGMVGSVEDIVDAGGCLCRELSEISMQSTEELPEIGIGNEIGNVLVIKNDIKVKMNLN